MNSIACRQYIRGQRRRSFQGSNGAACAPDWRHAFPLENSVVNGGSKSLTPRKPNRPNQRALQIRLNLAPNKVSPPFYLYPGNQTLSILTCEKGSVQENNPLRRRTTRNRRKIIKSIFSVPNNKFWHSYHSSAKRATRVPWLPYAPATERTQ